MPYFILGLSLILYGLSLNPSALADEIACSRASSRNTSCWSYCPTAMRAASTLDVANCTCWSRRAAARRASRFERPLRWPR